MLSASRGARALSHALLLALLATLLCCAPALAAAGEVDPSFGSGGISTLSRGSLFAGGGVAVQSDGGILVEGQETTLYHNIPNWVVDYITVSRFLPSGAPDRCFGHPACDGDGTVEVSLGLDSSGADLALQPDGKILAAGAVQHTPGHFALAVVRLNADGTLDNSFGQAGVAAVNVCDQAYGNAVAVGPDGSLALAGTAVCGGRNRIAVAKLAPNGRVATGFGTGGVTLLSPTSDGWGVAVQGDGKVVVSGDWEYAPNRRRMVIARLRRGGSVDTLFGSGGVALPNTGALGIAYNVTVLGNGDILAGGTGGTYLYQAAAVRLLPTGLPDPTFGTAGVTLVDDDSTGAQTMALQPDGRVVFGSVQATVAQLNLEGAADSSFGTTGVARFTGPGTSTSAVNGVAVDGSRQRIYAAGAAFVNGQYALVLAALQGS